MIIDRRKDSSATTQFMNGFGNFNLDDITAESRPVYDQNKLLPGNQDGWGVIEWVRWHEKLKARLGLHKANQVFLQAWKDQSMWHWPYNTFKYDSYFTNYMEKNGIDVGHMISKITGAAEDTVYNASDVVIDAGSGIKNTIGATKILLPLAVTAIVVGAGYYVYKNYIDGDERISVYGQKI